MLDVFGVLRSLLKIRRVHIDNNVFRLHYSVTVIILLAFCIVVTARQYVGVPIDCIRSEGMPMSVINTYCWIHTTYTIAKALGKEVGVEVPHPGIEFEDDPKEFIHHKYYQVRTNSSFVPIIFMSISPVGLLRPLLPSLSLLHSPMGVEDVGRW
jgi:innexin